VLDTIALHLAPGGRFIFDMRNPAVEEWREWTPDQSRRSLYHSTYGETLAWNDVVFDRASDVAPYKTFYQLDGGQVFEASSKIAFVGQIELASMIDEAGLVADQWLGDWQGAPYQPLSPEIIPVGRLR
jgi:hypothetical protein